MSAQKLQCLQYLVQVLMYKGYGAFLLMEVIFVVYPFSYGQNQQKGESTENRWDSKGACGHQISQLTLLSASLEMMGVLPRAPGPTMRVSLVSTKKKEDDFPSCCERKAMMAFC